MSVSSQNQPQCTAGKERRTRVCRCGQVRGPVSGSGSFSTFSTFQPLPVLFPRPHRRLFVFPCFSTSLSPLPRPLFGSSLRPSVCAPTTWVSPRRRWFPRFAPILQLTQTRANGEDGERVRSGRSLPRHAETDSRRYFETCSLGRPQCKKKSQIFCSVFLMES